MEDTRRFFENVFLALTRREIEKYFSFFDNKTKCVIHGEHPLSGTYEGLKATKEAFNRFDHLFKAPPQLKVRRLIVEGEKGAALICNEGIRKDGKPCRLDYWLFLELSHDHSKVHLADHFADSQKLAELCAI